LNELSLTDLMHITALTPTQLVINRASVVNDFL
jgi:hypothetical protein